MHQNRIVKIGKRILFKLNITFSSSRIYEWSLSHNCAVKFHFHFESSIAESLEQLQCYLAKRILGKKSILCNFTQSAHPRRGENLSKVSFYCRKIAHRDKKINYGWRIWKEIESARDKKKKLLCNFECIFCCHLGWNSKNSWQFHSPLSSFLLALSSNYASFLQDLNDLWRPRLLNRRFD